MDCTGLLRWVDAVMFVGLPMSWETAAVLFVLMVKGWIPSPTPREDDNREIGFGG